MGFRPGSLDVSFNGRSTYRHLSVKFAVAENLTPLGISCNLPFSIVFALGEVNDIFQILFVPPFQFSIDTRNVGRSFAILL